jgi:hypothetical protein
MIARHFPMSAAALVNLAAARAFLTPFLECPEMLLES